MSNVIIVPLDGSELASRALPYAERLARANQSRLVLVRAVRAHPRLGEDPALADAQVLRQAEQQLDADVARLQSAGFASERHVYYDSAPDAILDLAHRQDADLIVMSTHGRAGVGRIIYGSVADEVLRRSEIPVLLVPATCDRNWNDPAPIEPGRVLVALDGSEFAEEILGAAGDLADRLEAELLLVEVVDPVTFAYSDANPSLTEYNPEQELNRAQIYLDRVADRLRAEGRRVAVRPALNFPAGTIAALALAPNVLAIALATRGRGGVARFVLGSVVTGVIQRTSVPVLTVRPGAGEHRLPPVEWSRPVEPNAPTVTLTLDAREQQLVQLGLEEILMTSGREEHLAEPVHKLLARLREARAAAGATVPGRV